MYGDAVAVAETESAAAAASANTTPAIRNRLLSHPISLKPRILPGTSSQRNRQPASPASLDATASLRGVR